VPKATLREGEKGKKRKREEERGVYEKRGLWRTPLLSPKNLK
jgi:hypothetical protein